MTLVKRRLSRKPVDKEHIYEFINRELNPVVEALRDVLNATLSGVGRVTLVGGEATVEYPGITEDSVVLYARQSPEGTLGELSVVSTVDVGFTISSSSATETSVVGYIVLELP